MFFLILTQISRKSAISCEIDGSSDASVKNAEIANLDIVLHNANIQKIFAHVLFYDRIYDIRNE